MQMYAIQVKYLVVSYLSFLVPPTSPEQKNVSNYLMLSSMHCCSMTCTHNDTANANAINKAIKTSAPDNTPSNTSTMSLGSVCFQY